MNKNFIQQTTADGERIMPEGVRTCRCLSLLAPAGLDSDPAAVAWPQNRRSRVLAATPNAGRNMPACLHLARPWIDRLAVGSGRWAGSREAGGGLPRHGSKLLRHGGYYFVEGWTALDLGELYR